MWLIICSQAVGCPKQALLAYPTPTCLSASSIPVSRPTPKALLNNPIQPYTILVDTIRGDRVIPDFTVANQPPFSLPLFPPVCPIAPHFHSCWPSVCRHGLCAVESLAAGSVEDECTIIDDPPGACAAFSALIFFNSVHAVLACSASHSRRFPPSSLP